MDSVVYCIGHLGELVREEVGDGARWGLAVAYVDEGTELRGTAGALALAAESDVLDERFLLLYGDSWLQVDPGDVFRASVATGLPALMTVFENHDRWDRSNVGYANGLVVRYEKGLDPVPAEMAWIDYGLSVLTRDTVVTRTPGAGPHDLAPVFGALAAERLLAGYVVRNRFYEIGSPEGLAELDDLLSSKGTA